jgi:hypothetical protein
MDDRAGLKARDRGHDVAYLHQVGLDVNVRGLVNAL